MMYNKNSQHIPGKKGSIARLILLSSISVIGLLSSFATIPHYVPRRGLGLAILEAFGGCGVLFLVAAFFWGFLKWICSVAPKSFGLANRFWIRWQPLTFLGLYIKACFWLILAIVPCSIFGFLFPLIFNMTFHLAQEDIGFFSAMALFLGGGALVVILAFTDICKLRQRSVLAVVKEKLYNER